MWVAPPIDWLKLNVDGASSGSNGEAGIRGILRDNNVVIKALFSKSIDLGDFNLVELLAIREAFLIYPRDKRLHMSGL